MTRFIRPDEYGRFAWGNGVVTLTFGAYSNSPVRLLGLSGRGMRKSGPTQRRARPIVELLDPSSGTNDNRLPLTETVAGRCLRFVSARVDEPEAAGDGSPGAGGAVLDGAGTARPRCLHRLEIVQFASFDDLRPTGRTDDETPEPLTAAETPDRPVPARGPGITVTTVFEAFPGLSAVRTYTKVEADRPHVIEAVSSLSLTLPMDANDGDAGHTRLLWADSAWAVENDWHIAPLRDTALRDRSFNINPGMSSSRVTQRSSSTWSTGQHQPDGVIEVSSAPTGEPTFSVMWQIEHNGPWEWEIGEDGPELHVVCFGPENEDHQWFTDLHDGPFISVPVSFSVAAGGWQRVVAEMTLQRRMLRREKAAELGRGVQLERTHSMVVYNDYMNTLFGDPRLETELPLIEGAAKAGADIFCIDAGWYDSTDGGWWDMVGEWQPSTNRFGKAGLAGLARAVRNRGMGLGLWLEPEVIGVRSPLAASLPDDAFIRRHGERVSDSGRFLLDFRSQAARDHVTRTVDRLIDEFDVAFFKFDYNTMPGVGADDGTGSAGEGLLGHCRAYLDWLDDLRRRHPDVMIENCASGAMRADYAQLSRLDLQSTSDQCDPVVYAAIAAGAGMTILPEQQGNWGYAQPEMDDETAVFTLASGILGRLYLSGFIDRMDDARLALVRDAVALHRTVLDGQRTQDLVPWWPAGLPRFTDDWLVSGLRPGPLHGAGFGRDGRTGQTDQTGWTGDGPLSVDALPSYRSYPPAGHDSMSVDASHGSYGYITVWRRGGAASMDIPLPDELQLEQVFPNPTVPSHAPSARPWTIDHKDGIARLTVADAASPAARVFRVVSRSADMSFANPSSTVSSSVNADSAFQTSVVPSTAANPETTPDALGPEKRAKVEQYRELNRTVAPGGVVCAGSSLMEFFPVERMVAEAGLDINLHNRGVAGFVADELLACLDECILALRPSRLIINIGTNDLNDPATTNDVLVARYDRILVAVERALPGIDVTMLAYYPVNPDVAVDEGIRQCLAARTNERLCSANGAVRALAARHGARFVDLNAPLLDDRGRLRAEYTMEGMHLNEAGYRAILPAFLDLLRG